MNEHRRGLPEIQLLDPARDPERWERMVRDVLRAAAPELQRRAIATPDGLLSLLSAWLRPALSAAAALALAAASVLALTGGRGEPQPPPGIAESLGYPGPVARWVEDGQLPSVEELLVSLEGSGR
jgi:hypothetical protein